MKHLKIFHILLAVGLFAPITGHTAPPNRQYYEIRIYHLANTDQEKRLDAYLRNALIPALHKNSIYNVGVFKPLSNDTASDKKTYVIIPYRSLDQFNGIGNKIENDKKYLSAGADYLNASHDNPPYLRIEKTLARAFEKMPVMQPTKLSSAFSDRVYELRSYESATEKLHALKVKMFNDGDEISVFKRLGFNAVFYSQAMTGTALPNLFYMTTFENMASHDEHWKSFGADPQWKKLSGMAEYANAVSKANIYLLRPTDYSDY